MTTSRRIFLLAECGVAPGRPHVPSTSPTLRLRREGLVKAQQLLGRLGLMGLLALLVLSLGFAEVAAGEFAPGHTPWRAPSLHETADVFADDTEVLSAPLEGLGIVRAQSEHRTLGQPVELEGISAWSDTGLSGAEPVAYQSVEGEPGNVVEPLMPSEPATDFTYEQLAEAPWEWLAVPEGVVYQSYIAGEKEPRIGSSVLYGDDQTLWDAALGGRASVVRFGTARGIEPEGIELQVEGAAFVRLLPEEERDVMSADFRFGVPLAWRRGPFQAKLAYYHISSHLGDEFLLKNPGYQRINYVHDGFVIGVGYFPIDSLRLYAELGWAFFTAGGAKPWEVQTGLEYSSPFPTGWRGAPYFAMNVYLREEVDWGGSLNILTGWQWRGATSQHVFRAGIQYYNGYNAQYSFLPDSQQLFGIGLRYDY